MYCVAVLCGFPLNNKCYIPFGAEEFFAFFRGLAPAD